MKNNNSEDKLARDLADDAREYSSNDDFNNHIDDQDYQDYVVVLRNGEEETPVASPSKALFHGDRPLYEQEARHFCRSKKSEMLRTDEFSRNEATFDELHSVVRRGITIPFVGAGMSVDAGCPGWTSYLLKCCDEARLDVNKAKVRLDNGEYESVIQDVIERLTTNRFELNFAQDFNHGDLYDSAVTRLPAIFGGCAITTNFDRVLEDAYSSSGRGFTEKVVGTHETGTFLKAIPRGERYLLKLHGNIDNPRHRVLTADEYDAAYGPRENINFRRELPKTLSRIFSGYTLVFLGCSLTHDRTLQTFESIVAREGVNRLPSHYAIVECPEDDDGDEMNARLARSNIKPIWYPFGEHEAVSEIIQLLQSETS